MTALPSSIPAAARSRAGTGALAAGVYFALVAAFWLPALFDDERRAILAGLVRVSEEPQLATEGILTRAVPLRERLVALWRLPTWWWLGGPQTTTVGPVPTRTVLVGDEGWAFLARDAMASLRRAPLDGSAIAGWASAYKRAAESTAVPVIVAPAPDKNTLYPHELPRWLRRGDGPSSLDALLASLAGGEPPVVDLRPALQAAARDGLVYRKLDTHWSDLGDVVVAAHLAAVLSAAGVPTRPAPLPAFTPVTTSDGDLLRVMGLEGFVTEEVGVAVPPLEKVPLNVGDTRELDGAVPGGPTLALVADSFGTGLAPALARHAGRVILRRAERPVVVDDPRIDAVLYVFVERRLARAPDRQPSDIDP